MGYFFLCKTRTSFLSIGVNFYFSKGQRKQQVYFFQETKKTTRKNKGGGGAAASTLLYWGPKSRQWLHLGRPQRLARGKDQKMLPLTYHLKVSYAGNGYITLDI